MGALDEAESGERTFPAHSPSLTMTAICMGLATVGDSLAREKLALTGDRRVAKDMQSWLGLSPFASEKKLATA